MNIELANTISSFEPENGNWLHLDKLFEDVFHSPEPAEYYPAIFKLFERFAKEDGSGVFWSALHGMEAIGKYEDELVRSFQHAPTEMSESMLIRLKNSGETHASGVSIAMLLDEKNETLVGR